MYSLTKQLGLPRRQRTTSRLVGALVVMDSRLVTRVENMATMSNLEVLEVDLNGTTSNSLRKFLLVFLPFIKFLVWLSLFLVWLCRLLTRLCSKIVIHVLRSKRKAGRADGRRTNVAENIDTDTIPIPVAGANRRQDTDDAQGTK